MAESTVSVGVLQSARSRMGTTIQQAIRELGHRAVELNWSDIAVEARNGTAHINADVDSLINWRTLGNHDFYMERLGMLRALEEVAPVVNPADSALLACHKPSGLLRLARESSANVPDTYYSLDCKTLTTEATCWPELVQKPAFGGGGNDVVQVDTDESVSMFSGPELGTIQSHIDTGEDRHQDVRAFVVDGEMVAAMRRLAPDDDWRTNISAGGDGEPIDLPSEASEMAVDAAATIGLDATGVDLIQNANGDWYVLEVNAPAGFSGLHDATGVNVAPYIAEVGINRAGGSVDPGAVEQVSESLDILSADDDSGELVFGVATGQEYELAGKTGVESVEVAVDEEFDGYAVDSDLAGELGVGPVSDTSSSAIPEEDHPVPRAHTWVKIGGRKYTFKASLCDLSNYDYDFVVDTPLLATKLFEPPLPEQSDDHFE